MDTNTNSNHDVIVDVTPLTKAEIFARLSTLPETASFSEVATVLDDMDLPFGVVSVVFHQAREHGVMELKNELVSLISDNPGCPLSTLVEKTGMDQGRVSALLTSLLGEESPRIVRLGEKRAAVYFIAGEQVSDEMIQDAILKTISDSTGPMSRPDILKALKDNSISDKRVTANLAALVESATPLVVRKGVARGTSYDLSDRNVQVSD